MSRLDPIKSPLLAQAVIDGHSAEEATKTAGYSWKHKGKALKRLNHPDFLRLVAERRLKQVRETSNVVEIIAALLVAAEAACKLGTGAGYAAAKGLYAEAAKLKRAPPVFEPLPPPAIDDPAELDPPFDDCIPDEVTEAEWLAKSARRAPDAP